MGRLELVVARRPSRPPFMFMPDLQVWHEARFSARWRLPRIACAGVLAALAACSPVLDWRSVPVPDTELVAQLPCRPGRFERTVAVGEASLRMFMLSCEAAGVTYGVATAEVPDPTRIETVLVDLATSARRAIRADGDLVEWRPAGATPFRGSASGLLRGTRPDGVHVDEAIHVFGRGTRVFEATAIGAHLNEAATRPFEEGLRFQIPE
jgi:hypothetical protein